MRTHMPATVLVLGLLGGQVFGEITDVNGDLSIEAQVNAEHMGTGFNDQSMASINFNPKHDSGLLLDLSTARTTGIFTGGTGGMVETVTTVFTDTQMYSFSHGMSNTATVGSGLSDYAESEHFLRLNSFVDFEEGDRVLINMRIEYEAVQDGQLSAELRVSGIAGMGPVMLRVDDPTEAGFVEFTTLTTVSDSRAFFLNADMESRLDAFSDRREAMVDGFSMSASFTLVPAPGTGVVLGCFGVLGLRRRR